jgi:hypothetical protein
MSLVHLRGTVNQVLLFCTPWVNDVTKTSHYMLTLDVPRDVTFSCHCRSIHLYTPYVREYKWDFSFVQI